MPQRAQEVSSPVGSSDKSDVDTGKSGRQAGKRNIQFAERLSRILKEREIGERGVRSRIAREIDVSKQVIGDWEKGTTPSADRLFRLADALGVNPRWLVSGEGDPIAGGDDTVNLPMFDLFDFSGGSKPSPKAHIPIRRDWLMAVVRTTSHLWLAEMPSDAMPDIAREGEMIICRDADSPLADGRVYVLLLDGRPIVRRVQLRIEGMLLKASDPDIEPIAVGGERMEEIGAIGRVLAAINLKAV